MSNLCKHIYVATKGPFAGYEGEMAIVAGVPMLKSVNKNDNWNFVLVPKCHLEFLCSIEV